MRSETSMAANVPARECAFSPHPTLRWSTMGPMSSPGAMSTQRRVGWPAMLALLTATYVTAFCSVRWSPSDGPVAAWWPAAGLAVVALSLAPRDWRAWTGLVVAIAIVTGIANWTGGRSGELSVGFGISNAVEALVAAYILRRGRHGRLPRMETFEDFIRLLGAALLGAAAVTAGALITLSVTMDGIEFGAAARAVFTAHAAGTLIIAPIAFARRNVKTSGSSEELAIQVVALVGATLLIFRPDQALPVTFVPFVLLVWAALRYDVLTVALELFVVSLIVTVATGEGSGPFAAAVERGTIAPDTSSSLSQLFLVSAALLSLPLAMTVQQRGFLLRRITDDEQLFRRSFTE
ncbi:MAG: hypothetical protein F2667_13425, partial [Actinobacteria bacterium]|nr:hypothetical protein [Actinomycetota bacterium]